MHSASQNIKMVSALKEFIFSDKTTYHKGNSKILADLLKCTAVFSLKPATTNEQREVS